MLPLNLDLTKSDGRTAQIVTGLRELILQGVLRPGEGVPSTRALAQQLGVARGTVVAAYDQLTAESYLISRPGAPTQVHPQAHALKAAVSARRGTPSPDQLTGVGRPRSGPLAQRGNPELTRPVKPPIDLRPQHRRHFTLDDPMWRAAWRRAATQDPRTWQTRIEDSWAGSGQLRTAISEHLRLTRSMLVDPNHIVVTAGAREGLDLILTALGTEIEPLAVENPGYRGLQKLLIRRGIAVDLTAADQLGIQPKRLKPDTRSVLVTPNHLYPLGGAMPAPRRMELLTRVQELGAVVIEDDYDSDFRHLDAPIPTLWELAPLHVIHLGTFHQVLTPEAHIGYLIAPVHLQEKLQMARADVGGGASPITQRAVADYLRSGGLRRHLARRKRELLRRRRLVQQLLAGFEVETTSGSGAVLTLAHVRDAERLVAACTQQGIALSLVADYWEAADRETAVPGCVINYGDVAIPELRRALETIVLALS